MRSVRGTPTQGKRIGNVKRKVCFARPVSDKGLIQLTVIRQHKLFAIGIQDIRAKSKAALVKKATVSKGRVGKKVFPQKMIPTQRGDTVAPFRGQFVRVCDVAFGVVVILLKIIFLINYIWLICEWLILDAIFLFLTLV